MNIVSSLKPNASAAVGATLLALPSYFIVASALRQNAPGLSFLGSPVVLLGSLLIAFALNALSSCGRGRLAGPAAGLCISREFPAASSQLASCRRSSAKLIRE